MVDRRPRRDRGPGVPLRHHDPNGRLWRIDPYAREVTNSVGNAIVRATDFDWGTAAYRTPPWDELVIYELHVGSFNDAPGGGPGSFASVRNRLDHLRDLGIVYNHFGPSDLHLWQFDGWTQNGMGGIYFYEDRRAQTDWGHTRPDYGRPEVVRFLRDNVRQWLEEFRFDGLRWDATAWIRNIYGGQDPANDIPDGWRLMQHVTGDTDARQPWKIHIAEDLRGNEWITRPSAEGGAGFDCQWDGDFVHPVRRVLTAFSDGGRNMAELRAAITNRYGDDALRRVVYTESHDEVANGHSRLPEEIWPGKADDWYARKRSTLGAVLVFTAPGIPMIFQGQEVLEDRWFHEQDPIDWTREQTFAGILALYRDLIRLRRDRDGTTGGLRGQNVNVHHVNDDDNVIAFHRWRNGGAGDDVVVIANIGDRAYDSHRVGMPRAGTWRLRFNSDWSGYSPDFGGHDSFDTAAEAASRDDMPFSASVGLPRYSALILSQDR